MTRCALLTLLIGLLMASLATRAEVSADVEIGWGGNYRLGHWTPLFLTVQGDEPRQAEIELSVPIDQGTNLRIRQSLVINPQPTTYALFAPLADQYLLDQSSLIVRDVATGRKLFAAPLFQNAIAPRSLIRQVEPGVALIGISGNSNSSALLQSQMMALGAAGGIMPLSRLPATPVGYDGLAALLLATPDIAELDGDQQQAILDWVRGGGVLVFWPGFEPAPQGMPLSAGLPVTFGQPGAITLSRDQQRALGLPVDGPLASRELLPAADAEAISLGDGLPPAYGPRFGFGRIIVLPVDVAALRFTNDAAANAFWRRIFGEWLEFPPLNPDGTPRRLDTTPAEQLRTAAIAQATQWLGQNRSTSAAAMGWLGILLGVSLIIGPVDALILRPLGRSPWNIMTTLGWLGLVVVALLYVGRATGSTVPPARSIELIDQIDNTIIGTTRVALMSPATLRASLSQTSTPRWTRPLIDTTLASQQLLLELPVRQDHAGTHPADAPVFHTTDTWFVESQTYTSAPGWVDAALEIVPTPDGPRITGRIVNLTDRPLTHLTITTHAGAVTLTDRTLAPAERADIDAPLAVSPSTQEAPDPSAVPSPPSLGGLTPTRTRRITHWITTGHSALITATAADDGTSDLALHRAIVPLAPAQQNKPPDN